MRNTAIQPAVLNAMNVVNLLNGALMQTVINQPMSLCLFLQGIVSTVRQFWKLGAAVRELGARTRRVRAPRPWCGIVVISQP